MHQNPDYSKIVLYKYAFVYRNPKQIRACQKSQKVVVFKFKT